MKAFAECYNQKPMRGLIDTHAHLEEIPDLDVSLAEARAAGVIATVAVGSDYASNQRALEIAKCYPGFVFPALGLHPWNIKQEEVDKTIELIQQHIEEIVGIGEIGLDYHKRVVAMASKEQQKQVFARLLDVAQRHNKPALVHSRYAWRDSLELVEQHGLRKAVFHWFTGPSSVLRDLIEQRCFVSATPAAGYHEEHRRTVREAPDELLLLETDSPVTYGRGSDSEFSAKPKDVRRSLSAAAVLRKSSEEDIARITTENAAGLFNLTL